MEKQIELFEDKPKRFTVILSESVVERLKIVAKKRGTNPSVMVREFILKEIEK